jgi:plasmid stabilization system protein ParE
MAQKVVWSLPASKDLNQIVQFIAKDSNHYAEEFLIEAQLLASRLLPFPRRGRIVPEFGETTIREDFGI